MSAMSQSHDTEPATERKLRSSTRNPRRRARQSDNDTLKTTAPRRKRSKISEDTFKPRDSTELPASYEDVDDFAGENISVANGHASHHHPHHQHRRHTSTGGRKVSVSSMAMSLAGNDMELAVRGGRKGTVKRAVRGDGATVLTQNDFYGVKLLPSTPKELRREGVEYRGNIGEGAASTFAVAVTRERAIIWDYTAHVPSANQRVFDVPFTTKPTDPLPFAVIVSSGAGTSDIGLLVISAATAKVVFYESIDRAASIGLYHDRKTAVDGSLGNLFSGESIVDVISADHAGFIVVFSSGRIAQLTLRDAQGKPKISSQFLRASEPSGGGLFGSIRGLWNGGLYINNLAAVHVRPLNVRGQMQVVSLTERAEILLWDLDWSGRSDFKGSFDLRDALATELEALNTPELASKSKTITALDFAIVDSPSTAQGNELTTLGASQPLGITLLLSAGTADMRDYALAELSVVEDKVFVVRLIPFKSYHGSPYSKAHRRPQLLLPRPGHTTYAVFEDAVVVVINKESKLEGPDAQLSTAFVPPITFEDAVYLRSDKDLIIQNASKEDSRTSQSSCIAFVKSAGLVRISTLDLGTGNALPKISAKTKIEQAVFHGILQDNILDFSRRRETDYDAVNIESAALAISDEILRATSPFIKPSPTSMEQHLATKSRALDALVAHVRQNFPALSQSTMWRLLWDAERIAAGKQLWITFEEHVATTSKGKRKATLLDELCAWFDNDENEQFPHRKDLASEDPVRRFFIAGLHRLEKLLGHTRTFLRDHTEQLGAQSTMPPNDILQLVLQVNDVWLRSLETVYTYRTEHAAEYGILPDLLEDGVLVDPVEYKDLGEFWTSTDAMVSACVKVAAMSRNFATKIYENQEASPNIEPLVREISGDNPRLIQLYCLMYQESINWRASRDSARDQDVARKLQANFDRARYDQFRGLAEVGQVEAGMQLAEKYRDMHTLTDMVVAEDQYLEESLAEPALTGSEKAVILQSRDDLEVKIRKYFKLYGDEWADAFFDMAFSGNAAGVMLTRAQQHWRNALTKYLQADPNRAKICWINDVTEEQDFVHAGSVLAQAATDQESRLWAKKVELSMSKLALMAAEEARDSSRALIRSQTCPAANPAKELIVADVQDKLYKHILPDIITAIDRQAELGFCMQRYASHLKDFSALRQLLEQAFSMILDHTALPVEDLIDVLTLMDSHSNPEYETDLQHSEFFLALVALDAAAPSLPESRVRSLTNLIWKRCYIRDDWSNLRFFSAKSSDDERRRLLRSTAIWRTYHHAFQSDFFSDSADDRDSRMPPLSPSDCLGSVCSPEEISHRFPVEDLLDPILHDLRVQDEILAAYVADRRLDEIVEECKRDARELLAEQAEERARFLREEREVEVALEKEEAEGRIMNGFEDETGLGAEMNGYNGNGFGVESGDGGDTEMSS